ncbi:MAG TPA: hypothetical protein VD948_08690 [Rhodothermales bacterium]|nr:hypothetical protein [Rhodothermales bacterium]
MPDTTDQILRSVFESPLLGEYAAHFGTASVGNTTTVFSDAGLVSFTSDTRWRNYRAYFPSFSQPDRDRLVYSTNLAQGQLQIMQPVTTAPASGTEFWLLRDVGYPRLLDYLNETLRNLYFEREVSVRGMTNLYRYTLPTPISRGAWVEEVYRADYPTAFSDTQPPRVDWYRINPLNVVGDLYLVLDAAADTLSADEQLVFRCRVPYLMPGFSAYTMSRSVLTPFGESAAISPPRDVVVAGVVWRILKEKAKNLTGEARDRWRENLKEAAQAYAEKLAPLGPKSVGISIGYSQTW